MLIYHFAQGARGLYDSDWLRDVHRLAPPTDRACYHQDDECKGRELERGEMQALGNSAKRHTCEPQGLNDGDGSR